MGNKTMNTRVQNKHDLEVNWQKATNFVPLAGEIIVYDADANAPGNARGTHDKQRIKIGDGKSTVIQLPFISDIKTVDGSLVVFPETTLIATEGGYQIQRPIMLVEGETYTVLYNDIPYTTICKLFEEGPVDDDGNVIAFFILGNMSLSDPTLADSGEPFLLVTFANSFTEAMLPEGIYGSVMTKALSSGEDVEPAISISVTKGGEQLDPQYIKGMYYSEDEEIILKDVALVPAANSFDDWPYLAETPKLIAGAKYRVKLSDFTSYECMCTRIDDKLLLGNLSLFGLNIGANLPFTIKTDLAGTTNIMMLFGNIPGFSEGIPIVTIIKVGAVNKIAEKYIPIAAKSGTADNSLKLNSEVNLALSKNSTAGGFNTTAGSRGFTIVSASSDDGGTGTFTLKSTTGLSVGMQLVSPSYALHDTGSKINEITSIEGNTVTVANYLNIYYGDTILQVIDDPCYGDVDAGTAAHAEGLSTRALGEASHAEGDSTLAIGEASHVEGIETKASGDGSHAEGKSTKASGYAAHAEGHDTIASGYAAHAEGYDTIASTSYQHVQGRYNVEDTEDKYAHIVGGGTNYNDRKNIHTLDWQGNAWFAGDIIIGSDKKVVATQEQIDTKLASHYVTAGIKTDTVVGEFSTAEGDETQATGRGVHAEGFRTIASGNYSHTEGYYTEAQGIGAHAEGHGVEGYRSLAMGVGAHVEGRGRNAATGDGAHAEGCRTQAEGEGAHAEGYQTHATGDGAHTEGSDTRANANAAHAEGSGTRAYGVASHAEGLGTVAQAEAQHVSGRYNVRISDNDCLFIIGNGTAGNDCSNAMEVWGDPSKGTGFASRVSVPKLSLCDETFSHSLYGMSDVVNLTAHKDEAGVPTLELSGNGTESDMLVNIENVKDLKAAGAVYANEAILCNGIGFREHDATEGIYINYSHEGFDESGAPVSPIITLGDTLSDGPVSLGNVQTIDADCLILRPADTGSIDESIYFNYYEHNNILEIGDVGGDAPVIIRGVADPVDDNEAANRGYVNRAIQDAIEGCSRIQLHIWEEND